MPSKLDDSATFYTFLINTDLKYDIVITAISGEIINISDYTPTRIIPYKTLESQKTIMKPQQIFPARAEATINITGNIALGGGEPIDFTRAYRQTYTIPRIMDNATDREKLHWLEKKVLEETQEIQQRLDNGPFVFRDVRVRTVDRPLHKRDREFYKNIERRLPDNLFEMIQQSNFALRQKEDS